MKFVSHLNPNDKVAIVSLSRGLLGESFIDHELELGIKRLKELNLKPVFMPNSKKGLDYLDKHPEARAEDLKKAFEDESIKMILCAIGGNDTYRTLPFLMNDESFKETVKNSNKIFMGFSDTTTNHLMLYKLGLNTFYGPAFLPDFAELEPEMLPYTKENLQILFEPQTSYEIKQSDVWYSSRTDFSPAAVGTLLEKNKETRGIEVLNGNKKTHGTLLGGCLDVLADLLLDGETYREKPEKIEILEKYNVFPSLDEWKDKIMFFETSEEKMTPEAYLKNIKRLKNYGVFNQINGLIVGKPVDETYYEEYKQILINELSVFDFPILFNLNFGHSAPRTIIPYGAEAEIDPTNKTLTILKSTLN